MQPRQIADRYDVQREVGRGGMGSVWLCTDTVLGRDVAVKQVGGLPTETSPQIARALREARSSAALNHPNVVSIFDAVDDGDRVWLIMEYLPSRTLAKLIEEDGALPPPRVARIGAQVAAGLAAAHAQGTVHRDVKPSNILVTDDDQAKIADFGIARTLGDDALTQTGLMSGTPLYFSPELARGADPAPAGDVWALGASLFAAAEGGPPWPKQENPIAMLMHIANNEPPALAAPGPLADLIAQMMTVDADQRPAMAEVRERLTAIAEGSADLQSTRQMPAVAPFPVAPVAGPESTAALPTEPPAPVPTPAPVPAAADGRRDAARRRALVGLVLAAVVLVAAAVIALAVGSGEDDVPAASEARSDSAEPSPENSPSDVASESAEPAPEPAPEPSEADPEAEEGEEESSSDDDEETSDGDGAATFVTDYYGLLPDDTKSAWELLSDDMQSEVGSYGSYRGFWRTIDAVSVESTDEVGEGVVEVNLTYVTAEGSESETRRITVAATESGDRIVGDQVA